MFEEALHALVVQRFRLVCQLAGHLHLVVRVPEGLEVQDAQAGTKSLFGVLAGDQQGLDQLLGLGSYIARPLEQALGPPIKNLLVVGGHMSGLGGVATRRAVARMCGVGPTLTLEEDLNAVLTGTDLYFLVDQLKGHRIEMLFEFHMVVNVHPGCFPGGIFIGLLGQRPQGRLVQFFE